MSFEGYYRILCKAGHLHSADCYNFYYSEPEEDWNCPGCKEPAAWTNLVDVTNGSYCTECGDEVTQGPGCEWCRNGRIDGYIELEIDTPAEYETCRTCGHNKLIKKETYKIPKKEEPDGPS